jgi:hypothetical protein
MCLYVCCQPSHCVTVSYVWFLRFSEHMLGMQSSLMGPSLTIPIMQGRLALGTWQGETARVSSS